MNERQQSIDGLVDRLGSPTFLRNEGQCPFSPGSVQQVQVEGNVLSVRVRYNYFTTEGRQPKYPAQRTPEEQKAIEQGVVSDLMSGVSYALHDAINASQHQDMRIETYPDKTTIEFKPFELRCAFAYREADAKDNVGEVKIEFKPIFSDQWRCRYKVADLVQAFAAQYRTAMLPRRKTRVS